ncbi:hypothetical protein J671_3844 [Acinetobacter sp. 1130196]|nr:hypothetical protein J514_1867 [Acinetobacter sp. 1396970]EXE96414.1 hypothetical protein J594_3692 [Acinetobacter sp. 259052]EXH75145.1 hypothetical protein J633_2899 [Acinetobacter sp. 216872]EXI10142.1 hypothetical protein J604_3454 [Acinetobacter sp. 694762]EXR08408.1 hypothetical protein J671_3844 [Acinetobacter sp. 1130196]EXS40744.1 hypothetical protein J660_3972 [Acinetobacter sp. 88816]
MPQFNGLPINKTIYDAALKVFITLWRAAINKQHLRAPNPHTL